MWIGGCFHQLRFVEVRNRLIAEVDFVFGERVDAIFIRDDLGDNAAAPVFRHEGANPFDFITDFKLGDRRSPARYGGPIIFLAMRLGNIGCGR
jgi:hypothetical protein